jgi:hypothetical protein
MPHFVRLAEIDEQHFITACRHGLVHITWGRTTTRLSRDEFRRLVGLLERTADDLPPSLASDGQLRVAYRLDEDCELRVGSSVLMLSSRGFRQLVKAARKALRRLDEIVASGKWDREEEADAGPSFLEQIRRTPFSKN